MGSYDKPSPRVQAVYTFLNNRDLGLFLQCLQIIYHDYSIIVLKFEFRYIGKNKAHFFILAKAIIGYSDFILVIVYTGKFSLFRCKVQQVSPITVAASDIEYPPFRRQQ